VWQQLGVLIILLLLLLRPLLRALLRVQRGRLGGDPAPAKHPDPDAVRLRLGDELTQLLLPRAFPSSISKEQA
jgi:hypothetical protein